MEKIYRVIVGVGSLLTNTIYLVLAVYLGFIVLDRTSPVQIFDNKIENENVEQGKKMSLSFKFKRTKACNVTVHQFLVDSQKIFYGLDDYTIYPRSVEIDEGIQTFNYAVTVPVDASTGPASYYNTRAYSCNWFQQLFPVKIELPIVNFNITEYKE